MRYEKLENLFRLALIMQGSAEGVRLIDIQQVFNVSRRTAERMRDAVARILPQIEEFVDGDRHKRWRIRDAIRRSAMVPSLDELTALGTAIQVLESQGVGLHANALRLLDAKLKAAMTPATLRRIETDLDGLVTAEAIVHRPGPHVPVDPLVVSDLREAILAGRKVEFLYRSRMTGRFRKHLVSPLGFLYGPRPFLVAIPDGRDTPSNYAIDHILELAVLEDIATPPPGFDLAAYTARSFGVFQDPEGPRQVIWRFTAVAAPNARTYRFHPSQEIIDLPDGGIEVRFTASSMKEMAYHVWGWGSDVTVVEPPELITELVAQCEDVMSVYEFVPVEG